MTKMSVCPFLDLITEIKWSLKAIPTNVHISYQESSLRYSL
jgi:hypothetical protein